MPNILPSRHHLPISDRFLVRYVNTTCAACRSRAARNARYTWEELLDASRRHPFLFEHHPKRNVWSFARTVLGGMLPIRFWRKLRPTHEIVARRLVLYWIIVAILALFPLGALYVRMCMDYADYVKISRVGNAQMYRLDPYLRQRYSSPQAYLDGEFPLPPSPRFFYGALTELQWTSLGMTSRFHLALVVLLNAIVVYLAWPWLTLACFAAFRTTLRTAKLRRAQLARCVIYSSDASALLPVMSIFLCGFWLLGYLNTASQNTLPIQSLAGPLTGNSSFWIAQLFCMTLAGLIGWFMVRFAIAMRCYLQLRHAIVTALLIQIIVALLALLYTLQIWESLQTRRLL